MRQQAHLQKGTKEGLCPLGGTRLPGPIVRGIRGRGRQLGWPRQSWGESGSWGKKRWPTLNKTYQCWCWAQHEVSPQQDNTGKGRCVWKEKTYLEQDDSPWTRPTVDQSETFNQTYQCWCGVQQPQKGFGRIKKLTTHTLDCQLGPWEVDHSIHWSRHA